MISLSSRSLFEAWSVANSQPGREIQQAFLRLIIGGCILIYLFASYFSGKTDFEINTTAFIAIFFVCFSLSVIVSILNQPSINKGRRVLGILADAAAVNYSMLLAGAHGAVIFPVLVWITIGNGLRYGKRYLLFCAGASLTGFTLMVTSIPTHWDQTSMIAGIVLSLVLLPLYASKLIQQLHNALDHAEQAKQAAIAANESKSRFIANAGHEFRTPLNAIIGSVRELANTHLDPDQKSLVNESLMAADSLYDLADNVLDYSKLEAKKLELEAIEFDVDHLIVSATRMFHALATKKNLCLNVHVSPQAPVGLIGDPLRLRQILVNLVSNAIKFTESGSIDVAMACVNLSHDHATLRFEICDTGIGIKESELSSVFDSYRQGDDSITRRYGGTGLGMSIAKEIVELKKGTIGVESVYGEGATFWFEVTYQIAQKNETTLANTNILVLTPPEGMPLYLMNYLNGWQVGYESVRYTDRALSLISNYATSHRFDAVLLLRSYLDIDLKSFIPLAREKGLGYSTPVILADNIIDPEIIKRLYNEGLSSIIGHPLGKSDLYNALHFAAFDRLSDSVVSIRSSNTDDSLSALNILAADDSPMNLKVLTRFLEQYGCNVTTATDGETVLDLLEQKDFDLVFVDFNMPDMSGIDVTLQARMYNSAARKTPFIMLTGDSTEQTKQACITAGIDCVLTKPIDSTLLKKAIKELAVFRSRGDGSPESVVNDENYSLLDLDVLEELTANSKTPNFAAQVIDGFITEGGRLIKLLSELSKDGKKQALSDVIHSIKGNAGYVGAASLIKACTQAELLCRSGNSDEALVEMIRELSRVYFDTALALKGYALGTRRQAQ